MNDPRLASASETALARTWLILQGWPEQPDWVFSDLCYVVPGVAAVWLFTSNSKLFWIENLVGNPLIDKEVMRAALPGLLSYVSDEARKLGGKAVMTSTSNRGAARAYLADGYKPIDQNCVQYLKTLGEV